MWLQSVLISWITIIPCVTAFHPYVPAYRCIDDGDCSIALEFTAGGEFVASSKMETTADIVTLKLRRRIESPHNRRGPSLVDKLYRKYRGRDYIANTNAELVKKSNKYSITTSTTPTQANSAAIDQDGTDFSYFAVVDFGSSATPMYMLIDTGASDTWLMGSSCSSTACQSHNSFGASNSQTYNQSSETFNVSYGTGSVSGVYASDTVAFAGFSFNMTFGVATTTSDQFSSYPMDGIMGLARTSQDVPSIMDVISNSKALKTNMFGINLNRASDGGHDGEINFGAADTSKFSGNLGYTTLATTNGAWVIGVDDVGTGNKGLSVTGRVAYVDTGTSYIFLPPADAKTLHQSISGSSVSSDGSTWYVPCSTTTAVQFFFSGIGYNVSSEDWVGGKVGDLCTSNIYAIDVVGNGGWLLGDTFLKNVYAVFDADNSRIGFGSKSTTPTSTASSTSSGPTSIIAQSSSLTASVSSTTGISGSPVPFDAHVSSTVTTSIPNPSQSSNSASSAATATTTRKLSSATYFNALPASSLLTLLLFLVT